MIKTSLVSVVIPAYNAEKTIADCLDTVNDQTYPDIEIIVINDGSADQTLKLLEEYQRFSLRPLRIYTQKNAGIVGFLWRKVNTLLFWMLMTAG